jgi:hypothetical protein
MYNQTHTLQTPKLIASLGLETFADKYSVEFHHHPKFPDLVFLNFDGDFDSKTPEEIAVVCECNGLVLDSADEWRVVCMPYYKVIIY